MESIKLVCSLVSKHDYMTSVDLKDAFLHVLIRHSSRKYLQFQWKGRHYQFRVLPFGLSLAPFVFTKVLKPILRWARRKGIRLTAYLDDLLIVASSKEQSQLHTQMVLERLTSLGFVVNHPKSHLVPTQVIEHLGFTIDSRKMTLAVPPGKVRDLRREACKIYRKGTITLRALSSFIGKALAMTAAVLPARLKTQYLVHLRNDALQKGKLWTDTITLTEEAKADLRWWEESLQAWNGHTWINHSPQEEIFTDASDNGWGIVHNRQTYAGTWSQSDLESHINLKELMVIWHVVTMPHLQGRRLHIYCDNTTTIAYINRFGGTRSEALMTLANQIWTHCLATGTTISTSYVPSQFNPADPPSRQMQAQLEWSIAPTCFQQIDELWGPHHIDLFATNKNNKTPLFMSWKYDPMAVAQNALLQDWRGWGRLYICPPWNLIPIVLERLRQHRLKATVITPSWPGAIWYPTLQAMTKQPPLILNRSAVRNAYANDPGIMSKNPTWFLNAWTVNDD